MTMLVEFTGAGLLAASGEETYPGEVYRTGVGTLLAVGSAGGFTGALAAFTGGSALVVAGGDPIIPEAETTLGILDSTLTQAPTSVVVFLTDADPSLDVVFTIDGEYVHTASTDVEGSLGPLSVPVPETVGAVGSHTITASQGGTAIASGTFTLARSPNLAPIVRGPDAQAVDVPGAVVNGRRKWVLQDLMPGGLGSYVMPWNPTQMTAPHVERVLSGRHTTAQTGRFHVFEGGPAPVEWKFNGYCTQEIHDKLLAFKGLNRRFYVIDHRGRAWKVTFLGVDLEARLRQAPNGVTTDWGHDYTVTALVYDQEWVTPA